MDKAAKAGKPDNWEKYLPAETQAYVRNFRERTGAEPSGGVALDEAGGPVERPAALDAERAPIAGPERIADVPELRRELFPDETSWRIAQAGHDAEALGVPPAITRQSVWNDARASLEGAKSGEIPGALYHPDLGPIDVKWGEAGDPDRAFKGGYGLAHIAAKHPEVMDALPEILGRMDVIEQTPERAVLASPDHRAVVALTWHDKEQQWLLSAYERTGASKGAGDMPAAVGGRDASPGAETADRIAEAAGEEKSPVGPTSRRGSNDSGTGSFRSGEDANIARQSLTRNEGATRDDLPASASDDPHVLEAFDDPAGEGAAAEVASLVHDARAEIARAANIETAGGAPEQLGFRFEDGEGDRSLGDVLDELDADEATIAAIKECL
jgi:hypothetical protein